MKAVLLLCLLSNLAMAGVKNAEDTVYTLPQLECRINLLDSLLSASLCSCVEAGLDNRIVYYSLRTAENDPGVITVLVTIHTSGLVESDLQESRGVINLGKKLVLVKAGSSDKLFVTTGHILKIRVPDLKKEVYIPELIDEKEIFQKSFILESSTCTLIVESCADR